MALVDKETANGPWAAVEVFIAAPGGGIDIPIMEVEGDVTDGMGEIPQDKYPLGARMFCYERYVEELAGVELDSWEEKECRGAGMLVDD